MNIRYEIEWRDEDNKIQKVTIIRSSIARAVYDVCALFEVNESDITQITKLNEIED